MMPRRPRAVEAALDRPGDRRYARGPMPVDARLLEILVCPETRERVVPLEDERLESVNAAVREVFDFRPAAMIDQLHLRRPVYKQTAAYGHFGRNEEGFTWEATDRVDALKRCF